MTCAASKINVCLKEICVHLQQIDVKCYVWSWLGNDLGYWWSRNKLFMLKSCQWDCVFGPSNCELSRSWNISFSTKEMTPPPPPPPRWLASVLGEIPLVSFSENLSLLWALKPEEQQHEGRMGGEVLRFHPVWGAHISSKKRHLKQKDHLLNVNDSSHKLYNLTWRCLWSCCGTTLSPTDYGGFHIK